MLILRSLQAFFRSVQYETNHRIKLLLIIRFFCKKYQIKGIAVLNIFMLEKMEKNRLGFSVVAIATKTVNFPNFCNFIAIL